MHADLLSIPAKLSPQERTVLYALVRGLAPACVLEIGVFEGGSSRIIHRALADNGLGMLVSVDPEPRTDLADLGQNVRLIKGSSPQALPDAFQAFQTKFDFAFIDGNHSHEAVVADTMGTLPYLAEEAYLLYHDHWHPTVASGIDACLASDKRLSDCGVLARSQSQDSWGRWGGMRLLRYRATP